MPDRELSADCSRCQALCCVAPTFSASADFAIHKPAGAPCPHLRPDRRCGIHDRLRERGFPGCAAFDCFGAGQRLTRQIPAGRDWRDPSIAGPLFAALPVVRALHELLWYLREALALPEASPLRGALLAASERTDRLAGGSPEALGGLDLRAVRGEVNALLLKASALARAGAPGPDHRGADLIGADLRRRDLRGASLRGALLLGADLRRVDLGLADLTGADLRGADLRGADLSSCLFLHPSQLEAALGDPSTRLPEGRLRPGHWTADAGAGSRGRAPRPGSGAGSG